MIKNISEMFTKCFSMKKCLQKSKISLMKRSSYPALKEKNTYLLKCYSASFGNASQ